MTTDLLSYIYAATVAAGGCLGYVKSNSVPSLLAGVAFGGLLGYGAYLNSQNTPRPLLQLATTASLGGLMYMRFLRSGRFMPAGLISYLSAAMLVRNAYLYYQFIPMPGNSGRW